MERYFLKSVSSNWVILELAIERCRAVCVINVIVNVFSTTIVIISLSCICDHSWSQDWYGIIPINLTERRGKRWRASTHPAERGLTSVPRESHIWWSASRLFVKMCDATQWKDIWHCTGKCLSLTLRLNVICVPVVTGLCSFFLTFFLGKVLVPSLFDVRVWFIKLRFRPPSSVCFAHLILSWPSNFPFEFELSNNQKYWVHVRGWVWSFPCCFSPQMLFCFYLRTSVLSIDILH